MQGSAIAKRSNGEVMNNKLDYAMGVIYVVTWIILLYFYSGGPK